MRWLSIVILTFFCFQNSKAQDDNKLSWNENTKLVWNNFEAYPDSNSTSAAITYSEISYGLSAEIINDKVSVNYEVKCFFIPGKSWVKKELADDKLLAHEQLHFDITELYARKFRKSLSEKNFSKEVKSEFKQEYKKILKALKSCQDLYDHETNHSIKEKEQLAWQTKIKKQLKNLEKYKSDN